MNAGAGSRNSKPSESLEPTWQEGPQPDLAEGQGARTSRSFVEWEVEGLRMQ